MSRNSVKTSNLLAASVCAALLFAAPGAFAASNSLQAYVAHNYAFDPDVSLSSNTGPVSYDSTPGTPQPVPVLGYPNIGEVAGSADFGALKAQATASSTAPDTNRQAYTDVNTNFSVTVDAATPPPGGGPGLSFGDSVSLNLSFSLDGILNSGATGYNTGSSSMNAKLRIVDPNIQLDCGGPDGCITPRLVDFNASAATTTYGSNGETVNNWNWGLTSNDALGQTIATQGDSNSWVVGPGATCLSSTNTCYDINFNTGVLTTTIDTTVGATLDISGRLNILSQATLSSGDGYGAYGSGNFLDTLGMQLTPGAGYTDTVTLNYGGITPAAFSPVPLPPAVWLFGSGLLGLIGIARRRSA